MGEQEELFGIPESAARASRVNAAKWGGREAQRARARCRAMLPHPCRRCGVEIPSDAPEASWHAGHAEGEEHASGGSSDGIEPEHARCNTSAGGRIGAAITNAARAPQRQHIERERVPQWW